MPDVPDVTGASPWESALARLEEDVALLEAVEAGAGVPDLEPWAPPQDLGPLPRALAGRARAVLARQRAAVTRLATAVSGNRQQARVADSVRAATAVADRAAYVDVRA